MFASATGSRVCRVSECDSCDRLISGCYKKHQLLPLRSIGPSTFADVAVHVSTRASSSSLLLRRTAKFCPDRGAYARLRAPFSVFATCGRSGPVCYSLCPLLWRVCNAPEVEHWPQFLFSRAPGQVFFSLLGENNCQHLTESLKQQPVHVNQAVCGHSHIKTCLQCSWLTSC